MKATDLLTVDDVTQPINEWALDFGIPAEVIIERLAAGRPPERAVMDLWTPPREPRDSSKRYAFNGKALTIAEWAGEVGIAYNTLYRRIARGWSIERALGERLSMGLPTPPHLHTAFGKTQTLRQWSADLGINVETLRARLSSGWSPERAFGEAIHRTRPKRTRGRVETSPQASGPAASPSREI